MVKQLLIWCYNVGYPILFYIQHRFLKQKITNKYDIFVSIYVSNLEIFVGMLLKIFVLIYSVTAWLINLPDSHLIFEMWKYLNLIVCLSQNGIKWMLSMLNVLSDFLHG